MDTVPAHLCDSTSKLTLSSPSSRAFVFLNFASLRIFVLCLNQPPPPSTSTFSTSESQLECHLPRFLSSYLLKYPYPVYCCTPACLIFSHCMRWCYLFAYLFIALFFHACSQSSQRQGVILALPRELETHYAFSKYLLNKGQLR